MAIMENETRGYSVIARSGDLILGDPSAVSRVGESLLTNCPWLSEDAEISPNLVIPVLSENRSVFGTTSITNHSRLEVTIVYSSGRL